MSASRRLVRVSRVASQQSYQSFPDWLGDQVCRRDEIGRLARLAVVTGAIDRSDPDQLNLAFVEWAQSSRTESKLAFGGGSTDRGNALGEGS